MIKVLVLADDVTGALDALAQGVAALGDGPAKLQKGTAELSKGALELEQGLEKLSAKAACSSNSFSVQPLAGLTWLTAKTPLVRVPVLSNTAMEVLASASR